MRGHAAAAAAAGVFVGPAEGRPHGAAAAGRLVDLDARLPGVSKAGAAARWAGRAEAVDGRGGRSRRRLLEVALGVWAPAGRKDGLGGGGGVDADAAADASTTDGRPRLHVASSIERERRFGRTIKQELF
jgi:hypothetical protein